MAKDFFSRDFGGEESPEGGSYSFFDRDFVAAPTKEEKPISSEEFRKNLSTSFKRGQAQGFKDVVASAYPLFLKGAEMLGADPETVGTAREILARPRKAYEAEHSNELGADAGRIGGQVMASLPAMVVGGALLRGAGGLPGVSSVANLANTNKLTRFLSSVPEGAAQGMGSAALISGGYDEPIGEQLGTGAAIGGIIGPGARIAKGAIGAGIDALKKPFQSSENYAVNKLAQALERDGVPLQELENRLMRLGGDASVMDAGGANTLGLGRAVAGVPGGGKEAISEFLDERQAGQIGRVGESALKGLGIKAEDTFDKSIESLVERRAKMAAPLYSEAFKANQNIASKEIDRILGTPAGRKALSTAATKMQNDMALMGVPDAELAEQARLAGTYEGGGIAGGLKLRTLDYVKRSLDDQIGSAIRVGENDNARILTGIKNQLVNEIDNADASGLYKKARAAYAGPSQSMEALEAGKRFIRQDGTLNAKQLASMSDEDKKFFRVGAAKAVTDILHKTPDNADAVKRIFGSPAKREALASVFPSKEAFNDFAKNAKAEATFFKNRQAVLGNSRTAPMLAEMQDAGIPIGLGNALEMTRGNFLGTAVNLGKAGYNKLTGLSPEKAEAISRLLLSADAPPVLQREALSSGGAQGRQNLLGNYMNSLISGAGIGGAVSGQRLLSSEQGAD